MAGPNTKLAPPTSLAQSGRLRAVFRHSRALSRRGRGTRNIPPNLSVTDVATGTRLEGKKP